MNTPASRTTFGGRTPLPPALSPRSRFMRELDENDEGAQQAPPQQGHPHTEPAEREHALGGADYVGGGSGDGDFVDPFISQLTITTSLSGPRSKGFTDRIHHLFGLTGMESGLDEFRQNESSVEREYILLCAVQKLQQMLQSGPIGRAPTPHWQMTRTVEVNAKRYSKAFLYAPTLGAYRASNLPDLVIEAMREVKVAEMPDPSGVEDPMLASFIRAKLTTYRSQVKTKVVASLASGRHIADLTASIVHSESAVRPTVEMFRRVALLRWHAVEYLPRPPALGVQAVAMQDLSTEGDDPDMDQDIPAPVMDASGASSDDWWVNVDKTLAQHRGHTQVKLERVMNKYYDDDKNLYRQPEVPKTRAAEPDTVPKWIRRVNELAKKAVAEEGTLHPEKKRKLDV
ncbi:hypothetical protein EV122DRAFT_250411 [Schizophyllum commune]